MAPRWQMLAVLFAARMVMAFQFQTVAALSGAHQAAFGVGLDGIGLLIGLYLSPGIALAFPSGLIGATLGGKRGVGLGLVLMVAGAILSVIAGSWALEVTGRLIAGTGGILLNVLMTKMVTDWFGRRDLATAMGLFVSSWPIGIAAALLVLPPLEARVALLGADLFVLALCVAALVVFMALYRDPPDLAPVPPGPIIGRPGHPRVLVGIVSAGLIWALLNIALAVAFSFGTPLLVEQGVPETAGAARTSVVLWALAATIPLGGVIADRTGRDDILNVVAMTGFAVFLWLPSIGLSSLWVFALMGAFCGLSAGPVMSLPAGVLPEHWRAQGMGLFFTLYYALMMVSPPLVGLAAEATGTVTTAFWIAALLALLSLPLVAVTRRCSLPPEPETARKGA